MSSSPSAASSWPGKDLGLPATGPRSVARWGRRLIALAIDWAIASAIGYAFFDLDARFEVIAIFAVLQIIMIAVASGSIGHLIVGLRLVPLTPRWIGVVKPIVRTVLLCLVIPAAIWDRDLRGLHDKAAQTVLVRR